MRLLVSDRCKVRSPFELETEWTYDEAEVMHETLDAIERAQAKAEERARAEAQKPRGF